MLNFLRTFCGFSGPKYYGMLFYGQSKYHIFQNVRYYISIEIRLITDEFLIKDVGVYDSGSRVRGFGIKIMSS